MIEIQKNIPLPPDLRGRKRVYPLVEMEVGDSFLLPSACSRAGLVATAYKLRKKGFVFTTRTTAEGIRCWRVA